MPTACEEDGEPSDKQWQDHLSAFSVDNIKDHADALRRNDLSGIERTTQEFLKRYSLSIESGSAGYRLVCRELLKAEQTIAKAISERVQGNYGDAYGLQPTLKATASASTPSPALPAQTRLFSVAVTEYLKHFEIGGCPFDHAPSTVWGTR